MREDPVGSFFLYVILKKENEQTNEVSRVNFFCSGSWKLALANDFADWFEDAETSSAWRIGFSDFALWAVGQALPDELHINYVYVILSEAKNLLFSFSSDKDSSLHFIPFRMTCFS